MDKTLYIISKTLLEQKPEFEKGFNNNYIFLEDLKHKLYLIRGKYRKIVVIVYDIGFQRAIDIKKIFLMLSGAEDIVIRDLSGKEIKLTLWWFLIRDIPRIIFEIVMAPFVLLITYLYLRLYRPRKKTYINFRQRKKVVYLRTDHFFGPNKTGGSVAHIAGVANAFYRLGYRLFFLSTDKLELIDETKTPIYLIKPLSIFRNLPEIPEIAYNFKLVIEGIKLLKKELPGTIYQRYSFDNYSGVVLSRLFNIPLVLEYNGSFVWMEKKWCGGIFFEKMTKLIEDYNLNNADLIVVVSDVLRDELLKKGINGKKILVNPNGVDIEKYHPDIDATHIRKIYNLDDLVVVGFIATFWPWHGAEVLARSIPRVINKNKKLHFLFVGNGVRLLHVKKLIRDSGVEKFVTFTGAVSQGDAPYYLACCDILVSPHVPNEDGSKFFGSPTKLFEYMAMGKGIVASNLEQIGQILRHNYNAILVEPGNVEELSEGILKLASDRKLREFLGKNARKDAVRYYTWENNVRRVLDMLNKLE